MAFILSSPYSLSSTTININHASSSPSPFCPFTTKPSLISKNTQPKRHRYGSNKLTCTAKHSHGDQEDQPPQPNIQGNRRNVLLGLGSLYGAAATHNHPLAFAGPILPPDLTKCGPADLPETTKPTNCCPPLGTKIIDFEPPPRRPLRQRPAAHLASDEYIRKYNKAVGIMRSLPSDDPRSFFQQANIHCAYCDGAYDQVGFPDLEIQVHNSWLFFPFHRWYLYFHERILGSLIGDPTFALPFWNWDSPPGMQMPKLYTPRKSAIYDPLRNASHQPPTLMDLDFDVDDTTNNPSIPANLAIMYKQMVRNSKTPRLFFGSEYRAGDEPDPGAGSVENVPHGTVHSWTGDNTQPNNENMGIFYSAARDPIFFCHHSNVDRMWVIWKTIQGGIRRDITDPDWLNAAFLFYDENKNLVRVKVKDCLDPTALGYTYQDVPIPWLLKLPIPVRPKFKLKAQAQIVARAAEKTTRKLVTPSSFPLVLDSALDRNKAARFDVYVNDEDDRVITQENSEFAGSFVNVPHGHKMKMRKNMRTCLRLGLGDLLDDLEAEDDDSIRVTLVPRAGKGLITIGGIKVQVWED
ncbi:polyphenol oxidase, chloroplastic-like [Senna tora]|uniref:Polyphenol oxidase, chloroplastic-like n=1 Tax=Senna tora TaxID=362788 RepID=A0A834SG87_9FABA|nr:polyphenol oxidase, chloroplastic-like [Senna tora]